MCATLDALYTYLCCMANNIITIQGEIIPFESWGDGFVSLKEVESQLNASSGDITININSIGGDVDEGFMIYSAIRRHAKDKGVNVTTYAKGRVSSIATVIFLAGDERIGNRFVEPFVHNAWTYAVGDANELTRVAADLERVNKRIASFYADHTELTYGEARDMMDNDTFIAPEDAVAIRFATKIEEVMRPVALQRITNKKQKTKTMAKNNNDVLAKLKKFLALEGASNAVELYTNTNETLVFSELNEGDTPKVGDRATIDGKSADGEYTLADGTVYVFDAGELTEIRDNDDDDDRVEVLTEEIAALKVENAELKASVNKILASQKATEKSFNALKGIISGAVVDEKDNEKKSGDKEEEEKKGLVGAINKRKTKNKK